MCSIRISVKLVKPAIAMLIKWVSLWDELRVHCVAKWWFDGVGITPRVFLPFSRVKKLNLMLPNMGQLQGLQSDP